MKFSSQSNNTEFSMFLMIRNVLYGTITVCDRLFPKRSPDIVVFCYHSIASDGWRFSVTIEEFKKQIEYLLRDRIPIKVSDLPEYISGKKSVDKKAFVLTFDDGYENILSVKDFLQERNIFPVAFVLSDSDHANYVELDTPQRKFLTDVQIRELHSAGWEIGSHSATHMDFLRLTTESLQTEIDESRKLLKERLGFPVEYFAYPKGVYTKSVLKTIDTAGYRLAFSMDDGYVRPGINKYVIPRVGVDGTHSMDQFRSIASPFSMAVRMLSKKLSLL